MRFLLLALSALLLSSCATAQRYDAAGDVHALLIAIRDNDSAAFERAGFLVSPRYGIAFVPDEPGWLTALARHCLPQWEAMR